MSTPVTGNDSVDPGRRYDPASDGAVPIETKVKASTVTAGAIAALITAILSVVENDQLIEGTPDWVPVLLSTLIAAGSTFAAGKRAPHTARPDLPVNQR